MYFQKAKEDKREAAEQAMLSTVQKKKFEATDPINKGIEFEALIEQVTQGKDVALLPTKYLQEFDREKLNKIIVDLSTIVQGGTWQDKVEKTLFLGRRSSYLVYGKTDVLKAGEIIYDIKYTGRKMANKFANSTQHRLYMYCTGIEKFSYLVSDGKTWWREDYYSNPAEDSLFLATIIREFREWLETNEEAAKAFEEKWVVVT